ncbi:MBOAT family O-acyltransferase [Aestuariicoccus sp. MJ-SS9]|uniref:MBOAT family O-acyltransferase n=1 Tax=Aestuariicoccus sp. MJ-SS9 TaxID=3079855 RepID=UPI0029144437|nr:MBOAT family O-acyltransferase [Aestuariicoccus sp. MJ-SS9]MDU8911442.1 MBOAT family O-acyltransferase [Aestuariicoccus sp. MJ-SS9]
MSFTSLVFLIFAPGILIAYMMIPAAYRRHLVAAGSLLFYAYWEVAYVPLLFASALIDYFASIWIHRSSRPGQKRVWLLLSILINLGILFFFKYWNFFTDNVNHLIGTDLQGINVLLPLGISFYTLQTMSYTFDVYRGKFKPETNFLTYFVYVSFFPQLVAGPIERASTLLTQVRNLDLPSMKDVQRGFVLIAWGFFAKLVIADNIAEFISYSFLQTPGGLILWAISFVFVAQVYFDFYGYTLIARGLASFMGINLSLNFRQPFYAKNMTSFWQRWHISLTKWVTDYIHIPLARRFPQEPMRSFIAIMAMCIVGLWHGASWNFVLFGLVNGLMMRFWSPVARLLSVIPSNDLIREVFGRAMMVMCISFVGILFFIRDFSLLQSQIGTMFTTDLGLAALAAAPAKLDFLLGLIGMTIFFFNDWLVYRKMPVHVEASASVPFLREGILGCCVVAILLFGNFDVEGFIYFEF